MAMTLKAALQALLCTALLLVLGCADSKAEQSARIKIFLDQWYSQAHQGSRQDTLCHGLGMLKHPQFTCAELLEAAATVAPNDFNIDSIIPMDCFADVCGNFIEVNLSGKTNSGAHMTAIHVLKQDNQQLKVYWYRNTALMAQLQGTQPRPAEKDPTQIAYDQLVARYPTLYRYPPCYGVRPSSSNLAGPLMNIENIDADQVIELAETTCANFCFSVVGQKIAPLCPTL